LENFQVVEGNLKRVSLYLENFLKGWEEW
jgi:hypothetical protein